MTDDEIHAGLTELFHDVFGDATLVLTPLTSAADVPGWDSVKMVSIVLGVEQRFDIRLRSREVDRLRNVGDLAELVKLKKAA